MKAKDCKIGGIYNSTQNNFGCEYVVVKKNKTTCHVRLWENGRKGVMYKNVRYSILKAIT